MNSKLNSQGKPVNTLVDVLCQRAEEQANDVAYVFLADGHIESRTLTFGALDEQARRVAVGLKQQGLEGGRTLLLFPPGLDVLVGFFGCLYAGGIAVPTPPPEGSQLKRAQVRLRSIANNSTADAVLISEDFRDTLQSSTTSSHVSWLDLSSFDRQDPGLWQPPEIQSKSIAYLQYTSGSTSDPKGVMVSHANLLHHFGLLHEFCGYRPTSATVTWMPYFHDYGLIEGMLMPLYNGTPCYLMSPLSFIKRPLRWLAAIAKYGATHSQAPNFAYQHCLRRIAEDQLSGLDLSSWQAAGNAAEPIDPVVMQAFIERFSLCGLRPTTMSPAYGLAEATLLVSSTAEETEPVHCRLDAAKLAEGRVSDATADATSGVLVIPSAGVPIVDEVAIVNPQTKTRCRPAETGEIWVSDPGVAAGYWNHPEETQAVFCAYLADTEEGPFLRTGDIGFLKDGHLFVSGRLKDMIIIRGMNHYPQDIEWSVQRARPELRLGHGAAFSIVDGGEERVIVIQELDSRAELSEEPKAVFDAVRIAAGEEHGLDLFGVVLVSRGTLPKTTSGKLQRRMCRQQFLAGEYREHTQRHVASWYQRDPFGESPDNVDADSGKLAG